MRTHTLVRCLTAATFALALITSSAAAQGKGKGNEKAKDKGRDDDRVAVIQNNGDVRRDNGDVRRQNGDVRRVPPGLAKKPGGMPPGQYKKLYRPADGVVVLRDVFGRHGYTVVRTEPYGSSQYVFYRLNNGPEQRAVILPGTNRLAFQNVPQQLLQEIIARLY